MKLFESVLRAVQLLEIPLESLREDKKSRAIVDKSSDFVPSIVVILGRI